MIDEHAEGALAYRALAGGDRLTIEEFVRPDDAPGIWDAYQEMVRGERDHFRLEKPYYRKDGQAVAF